jgi:hypothetical protein
VCCEALDSAGNMQAAPWCTSVQKAPQPAPQVRSVSATCIPSESLQGAPQAVACVLVASASSSPELHNSSLFENVVHAANLSAVGLFSSILATEDGIRSDTGLQIVNAISTYTRLPHASSEAVHAYVKLVTCPVSIKGPLAVLVAAQSPSRGFSTVHVHALKRVEECMEHSRGQTVTGIAGNHNPLQQRGPRASLLWRLHSRQSVLFLLKCDPSHAPKKKFIRERATASGAIFYVF